MGTQANWFVAAVESASDESDPWRAPIEEVGARIDLRDPQATLQLRLQELVHREVNLFNAQVTCPIKDRADTSCHACPVSEAGTESALSALCRLGREQESVLTEMAVRQCRDQ